MIKIIKLVRPECDGCMGASFGDCETCDTKHYEVTMCKDCMHKATNVGMWREKEYCRLFHAWVEPCDFCAWGERKNDSV